MLLDVLADLFDDLDVGRDQVIPAHARLARDAGGDDDDVRAGDVLVVDRAGDVAVEPCHRPALGEVQHLALDHALGLGDIQHDDVAEFLAGGPEGTTGADVAAADDGDFRTLGHDLSVLRYSGESIR